MTVCKLGGRREPIRDRRNEELLTDGISPNSEILPLWMSRFWSCNFSSLPEGSDWSHPHTSSHFPFPLKRESLTLRWALCLWYSDRKCTLLFAKPTPLTCPYSGKKIRRNRESSEGADFWHSRSFRKIISNCTRCFNCPIFLKLILNFMGTICFP